MRKQEDTFTILELGLGSLRPSPVSIGSVPLLSQYEIAPTFLSKTGSLIDKSRENKEGDRLTAPLCAREKQGSERRSPAGVPSDVSAMKGQGISLDMTDVWIFYTQVPSSSSALQAELISLLGHDERIRAERFFLERDQLLFTSAHALLRACLTKAAGARRWHFRTGDFGKPEIDPPVGVPPLSFSLTHTNGLVACAVTRGRPIGIDAESIEPARAFMDVAARYFAASEYEQLLAGSETSSAEAFYQIWTLKEAVAKAIGQGLSLAFKGFVFRVQPFSFSVSPDLGEDESWWQVECIRVKSRHSMAVAIRRSPETSLVVSAREIELGDLPGMLSEAYGDVGTADA